MRNKKVTYLDLDPLTVVAQCMDDQWLPKTVLHDMMQNGSAKHEHDDLIFSAARREFMRSLLGAQQIVVNRPIFYNHPTFQRAFGDAAERNALIQLLNSGDILPYLYEETDPTEDPRGLATNPEQKRQWDSVVAESEPHLLRLSWDEKANHDLIYNHLSRRFAEFCKGLNDLAEQQLLKDAGFQASDDAISALQDMLGEIALFATNIQNQRKKDAPYTTHPFVTRTDVNKAYVWEQGSTSNNFKFKKNNRFAPLLKQIIDLKYNVNLPDVLNRYSFTSPDCLPRSTLQEIKELTKDHAALRLADICGILASEAITLVAADIEIPEEVSFADIAALRRHTLWDTHAATLRNALPVATSGLDEQPFFRDIRGTLSNMQASYLGVLQFVTQRAGMRKYRSQVVAKVEFHLTVIGVGVKIVFEYAEHYGIHVFKPALENYIEHSEKKVAPVVVELVMKIHGNEQVNRQALSVRLPVLTGKVENLAAQIDEVRTLLESREFVNRIEGRLPIRSGSGLETKDAD